jgi:endoglucanase
MIIKASGGHHDAGDYNPRSHIEVAQKLMDAYEIAPKKFYDGQLNIPEKGNGIPDILDEACWALKLWIEMQDADGGVHNGTESAGDPSFIQTVELDPTGDYAYAKDAPGSYTFAGAMAQASRIWKSLGKAAEADEFLKKAVKAYEWADKNPSKQKTPSLQARDYLSPKAYASAQLLQTTGDQKYNKDFLSVCVWSKKLDSDIDIYGLYDQSQAAWAYACCDPKLTDPAIQEAIKKAIIAKADLFIAHSSKMAYAFIRHPWAPINWGTGAYENWLNQVVQAWKLTGDDKYKYWIVRTCDNTLGANPMGLSYVVGAGTKTVRAPLHNSRYGTTGEVVDGMQVEGPVQKGDGYRIIETSYPKIKENFACLYTFVDNHFAIVMNEGVVPNQAQSMAVFGLLLPDKK